MRHSSSSSSFPDAFLLNYLKSFQVGMAGRSWYRRCVGQDYSVVLVAGLLAVDDVVDDVVGGGGGELHVGCSDAFRDVLYLHPDELRDGGSRGDGLAD